ncbi:MAG: response regulator [Chloroflexi bacterium]|nr:response regulator [Chloroflexota bacterium]MDA0243666.1 response regulator [Chloroflexota bacterium]
MSSPFILIVEDDTHLAHIFTLTLRSIGLETKNITDGRLALEYLADHTPDLVLLDLNLPNASGLDILHYIRHIRQLDGLPVILATADDRMGETLRPEVDLLLLKPVSPEQLRLLVGRLLSKTKDGN